MSTDTQRGGHGVPTTFVLTDIERSTALWEAHGDAMGRSVERHEAIIAESTESNGGVLVRSRGEGDSCFCVFGDPSDAVRAVLAAQLELTKETWPGPAVRVRMAVHTGTAEQRDGQYYGAAVNRCARLRGIAHGGQTLLSAASADLVRESLPDGVSLRDLGAHRLPDLAQPERVYQLCHPELGDVFPALLSLDSFPNNLPIQLTRFVDRESELEELLGLLAKYRLVTLTGPGGSGKTRLALQAAASLMESFSDGVWLVRLGAVSDPSLVAAAIALSLGLREEPARSLLDTVCAYLERRAVLLLLDNCEHVVSAAATAAASLLGRCPLVKVIATSRQSLGIEGEVARPVHPLAVPEDAASLGREQLLSYGAVQLLRERGALARQGFDVTDENAASVVHICRRLDGIPLAIEFAAARLGSLGPAELARRLDDRFRLLSSGRRTGPERHQTLDAAVDWSYELLTDHERLLFRRLAIFAGSFTLDAIEAVCADDELSEPEIASLLSSLVDRSLVFADTRGHDTIYRLLSTIRAFARERVDESGEANTLRDRHLRWFVQLAERAEPEFVGADQLRWFNALSVAHDDIRSALSWGLEADPPAALRLATALGSYWDTRGHWTESRRWLEAAIAAAPEESVHLAHALRWAGNFAQSQGDHDSALKLLRRALAMYETHGEEAGVVHTLTVLGMVTASTGDADAAQAYFDEGLAVVRKRGRERRTVGLLINLGMAAQARGDAAAGELYREALALSREHGHKRGIAAALAGLASLQQAEGDFESARAPYQEALQIFRELGDKQGTSVTLTNLAVAARAEGDLEVASDLLSEALKLHQELGDRRSTATALARLGTVAWLRGDLAAARKMHTDALGAFRELGDTQSLIGSLVSLARIARAEGDLQTAASWLSSAVELSRRVPQHRATATCLEELAGLEVRRDPELAARLFGAAEAIREATHATGPRTAQATYERDVADLRERLPDFSAAWAAGRSTNAADAIESALQQPSLR